ncbi:hypothetical protein [Sorangium sp. So ce128]|uniref:hypothetical protein n=1 Tax=Sorangium sp. So ce128 TaxID=3133281 RepID=UPI003F6344AE
MKRSAIVGVSMVIAALAGCSSDASGPAEESTLGRGDAALSTEHLATFEARWPKRSEIEVASRAARLAKLVLDRKAVEVDDVLEAMPQGQTNRPWTVRPHKVDPDLVVRFDSRFDDLRVSHIGLRADLSGADIGEAAARDIFLAAFDRLVGEGLVDARMYEPDSAKLSRTLSGSAPATERAIPEVVEYTFRSVRRINGTEFVNAGLSISVHRSGRLSAIRAGGAEIASEFSPAGEIPLGQSRMLTRRVDTETIKARFMQEWPTARVHWEEPMYVMPDNSEGTIEPRYVFAFSIESISDGQQVLSRRRHIGYSVEDAGAAAQDYTERANPDTAGDVRR